MPLTDTIARNAKPAAKTVRMFDRDGLYLEVSPRGGKWSAPSSLIQTTRRNAGFSLAVCRRMDRV
jgi:hypothetical protein